MFRTPNRNFKKLLFFALNYAFRDESKYSFLYFAKYFVNLLMDDDRTEVIEFFKKKMPKGAEKNDTMLYVANYIKDFKYTAALKRRQSKQLTGTKKEAHSNLSVGRKVLKENHKNKEKKTRKKEQKVPKKKIYIGQVHKSMNEDSETEISDDLTIHDSESDDLEDVIRKDDV